jgi:serine/threonine-protein phosphatase 2A regulatory subunit A
LVAAGEDKSWKVRLAFAKNFADIADSFGKEITDSNLIQTFTQLLNDNEAEVKNAAIQSMTQCLKNLSTEKISNLLLPTLQNSYADAQTSFKAGVAIAVSDMASIVGKDYTLTKILPILMELIKDDNSEVKLNVCNGLIKVSLVIGPDVISAPFLATLTTMTKEAQWRVRMAVFELIGEMSKQFGKEVFQKQLETIFLSYLGNTAASVRDMGVKKAKEVADKYKGEWVMASFIPRITETYAIEK